MNSEEISALSKTHVEAIMSNSLTKAEVIMLVAMINARVQQLLSEKAPISAPVQATVEAKPKGAKIADKGYPCVCIMCNKHIYTLNADLYENATVAEFIEAYTPMPGYHKISRKDKISNIDNNITMNCPDCSGEFTLYLAGKHV